MPYVITQISQAVKNPDRVNIYLNRNFWIGLGKNDLLSLRLVKDQVLTDQEKQEIESVSSHGKLIEKSIRFLQIRPRSSGEVRQHLVMRCKVDADEADSVIAYLQERELLSDEKFAQWYIEYKFGSGFNGVNKIKTALFQKRVDRKVIDSVLEKLRSHENFRSEQLTRIQEFSQKILPTIKAKDHFELKSKLVNRLLSRGFTYNDIKEALKLLKVT